MSHITANGPIRRYLDIAGISIEDFFDLVKRGNLAAITVLGHEAVYDEICELTGNFDERVARMADRYFAQSAERHLQQRSSNHPADHDGIGDS